MVQPNRSQDFLVRGMGEDEPQQQNQGYRLNVPSFSGGQSFASTAAQRAQPKQPDRSRQQFRTRERQIRENRPIDFTVDVSPTVKRIKADIAGQATAQRQKLAESDDISQFLPDFEKAIAGDAGALQRTGQRLNTEYQQREFEPIQSFEGESLAQFLAEPSTDAYQTALTKQRAGTFGLNALDAAILGASGAGAQSFETARQELGGAFSEIPGIRQAIKEQEEQRARDYAIAVSDIRNKAQAYEQQMRAQADLEAKQYAERSVTDEIAKLYEQAQALAPDKSRFINYGDVDVRPFIDRDLTFAETLDEQEEQRYNAIAELLGLNPVQAMKPAPTMNKDAIIQAILANAVNEQTQELNAKRQQEIADRYRTITAIDNAKKVIDRKLLADSVNIRRPFNSAESIRMKKIVEANPEIAEDPKKLDALVTYLTALSKLDDKYPISAKNPSAMSNRAKEVDRLKTEYERKIA